MFLYRISIKYLLIIIVCTIAIPALGIIIYSGKQQRQEAFRDAQVETQRFAETIANEQNSLVSSTMQLFMTLSQLPEVQRRETPKVQTLLSEIHKHSPQYVLIFIADTSGTIWASSKPSKENISIADRRYFKNALSTGHLSSGEFTVGRTTKKATINLGYPLIGSDGKISDVLCVGIALEYYRHILDSSIIYKEASYALIDHAGRILTRVPGDDSNAGKPANPDVFAQMKAGPDQETSLGQSSITGDQRIQTYRKLRLENESEPYMYIRVGIPANAVMSKSNASLIQNMSIFVSCLVFACLFAWFISKRYIIDRLNDLKITSQRLAEGDLTARIAENTRGGEFGQLEQSFDDMAQKLALREKELADRKRFLDSIIDTGPECIKLLDQEGRLLMMNRAGLEMIEADNFEQVQGKCVCQMVTDPYQLDFMELTEKVFQGFSGKLTFETVGLKGRHIWLETHAVPFRSEKGEVTALLGVTRDVTEQKRSETLLNARIKLNELVANAGLDEMIQVALDEAEKMTDSAIAFFHFMDADQNNLTLTAWSTNTLKNMCKADGKGQHYSVDLAGVWVDCVRERKAVVHNDYATLSHKKGLPEGHAPIIRELVVPIIREDRIDAIIGVGNKTDEYTDSDVRILSQFASMVCDIAMRKRADIALYESEERLRGFVRNAPVVLFALDREGIFTFSDGRGLDNLGLQPGQVVGLSAFDMYKDAPTAIEGIRRALDGETLSIETVVGNNVFEIWYNPTINSNGELAGCIGVATIVTERKRTEEERSLLEKQLLHAQKLESLGVLAGGIAHDFNNILMSIIGNADLALMRINKESPATENLHRIEQAAARAADLAKQMLAYSGKGKFVITDINLNHLLEEMLHMLEVSISKKASLKLNLHQNLPSVEADATQIQQVIMNLIINSSEAIGDSNGIISIATGSKYYDRASIKGIWFDEEIKEGAYVFLEISDTGCGMDKDTLSKLFDPFFTTKFTGRGLGMAAVQGIVRGHKGTIKVYSEPNKGTTFKILLPASDKPTEIFNDTNRHVDWQGNGTVLLVDDEETVRDIGSEMLRELGFDPITANDGCEAVNIFKHHPEISFIILDLTMPRMGGEQCFSELRQINPNIKIIMSSGFNEQEVTQKFVGKGLAGFIQKPYKLSVLRDAIKHL